jgi:hypothetical protein
LTAFSEVPKERLDAQVLFDPFEEQLYLPAAAIEIGDAEGGQGELVGQEDGSPVGVRVAVLDATRRLRVLVKSCIVAYAPAVDRQSHAVMSLEAAAREILRSAGSGRSTVSKNCRGEPRRCWSCPVERELLSSRPAVAGRLPVH